MTKTDIRRFDYEAVGKLDAEMWRAYYNHQFIRLFLQLVLLVRQQLHLNWFMSLRMAFYSGWAATDYRLRKHTGTNNPRILKNLTKFYALVSRHSGLQFDYVRAAELELQWWEVHRASYKNNPALERSLAEAAAVVYGVDVDSLRDYARYRAQAMILPQHEGDDQPTPTDWPAVRALTVQSWKALHEAVQPGSTP